MTLVVGYLTGQYPAPSHTFIRREIAAVEAAGCSVHRYAHRQYDGPLVHDADREEARCTSILLDTGLVRLLGNLVVIAIRHPLRFGRVLLHALGARRSSGAIVRHLAYLLQACTLRRWCERDGVVHLHAHLAMHPTTVAMYTHRLGGPRFSFTVHGPESLEDPHGIDLVEKMQRARHVVAISRYCRDVLIGLEPSCADRITIVRCGVDDAVLTDPAPLPSAFNICCIGRLCPRKQQALLLEALALILADHATTARVTLTLVGDGPDRDAIEAQARSLGLTDCVDIRGWCDDPEVIVAIDAARVVTLPSRAEGLPVAIMEAMARSRTVVTTSVAAIGELVDSKTGWLLSPNCTAAELAEALHTALLTDDDTMHAMGQRGRARILKDHDASLNARALLDIFRA
jgi:colanic acid/amylovoran biosynthesis glycosyltransferase